MKNELTVHSVDSYRSQPNVNQPDDRVRLIMSISLRLWKQSHRLLDVDIKGNPLEGCGRQGCKVAAPKGVAVNGPCTCR